MPAQFSISPPLIFPTRPPAAIGIAEAETHPHPDRAADRDRGTGAPATPPGGHSHPPFACPAARPAATSARAAGLLSENSGQPTGLPLAHYSQPATSMQAARRRRLRLLPPGFLPARCLRPPLARPAASHSAACRLALPAASHCLPPVADPAAGGLPVPAASRDWWGLAVAEVWRTPASCPRWGIAPGFVLSPAPAAFCVGASRTRRVLPWRSLATAKSCHGEALQPAINRESCNRRSLATGEALQSARPRPAAVCPNKKPPVCTGGQITCVSTGSRLIRLSEQPEHNSTHEGESREHGHHVQPLGYLHGGPPLAR